MKRLVILALVLVLVGCVGGPQSKAEEWANRFPEEITIPDDVGAWQRDDISKLSLETQANYGYATVNYEGRGAVRDTLLHITVTAYATESAAQVALDNEQRNWQLQGVRFDAQRQGRERIDVAWMQGGMLAYYQIDDIIITVRLIPEEVDVILPAEHVEPLLDIVFEVAANG